MILFSFKQYSIFFTLLTACLLDGSYQNSPNKNNTQNQYQTKYWLDDKKILELNENEVQYNKEKDTNINDITTISQITYSNYNIKDSKKGNSDLYNKENWDQIKLIAYFEQLFVDLSLKTKAGCEKLKESNGNLYYIHNNQSKQNQNQSQKQQKETYYGVDNHSLKGKNLIGKMVQKMRDDPTYISRIQQKINSKPFIEKLHLKAEEYNKANKINGWQKIQGAIYFYEKNNPYYEFANLFESQVYADGIIWPTSEHYYQSMKFPNAPHIKKKIFQAPTGKIAFNIGQEHESLKDQGWKNKSLKTMITVVWLKFNQHEDLKNLLLKTGKKILVEDAREFDEFYGAGANYKGGNWLGCILMAVRDHLALQKEQENAAQKDNQSQRISTRSLISNNIKSKPIIQSSTTAPLNTPTPPKTESLLNKIWTFFLNLFSWSF